MKKQNIKLIQEEYFSFQNKLNNQIKDKNISNNNGFYLIKDTWDKELNNNLDEYEKTVKSKYKNNNYKNNIIPKKNLN